MNLHQWLKSLRWICCLAALVVFSCGDTPKHPSTDKLFSVLPSALTGIDFQNKIVETESSNYYKYMYTYIGGGVAAADFNNDGLEDLFLSPIPLTISCTSIKVDLRSRKWQKKRES